MRLNWSIDTDPQQQEAASPQVVVGRPSLRETAQIRATRNLVIQHRSLANVRFWPIAVAQGSEMTGRSRCKAVVHRPNWSRCSRRASFNPFTACRTISQCPPFQALHATAALTSGLFGPLDRSHGFHPDSFALPLAPLWSIQPPVTQR